MKNIFITATDTDAGKTFVSCAILNALAQHETTDSKPLTAAAFKPVAAGCELENGELINEDAKLLTQFANCSQSIKEVNPIAFKEAIAPHIAAKKYNQTISVEEISEHFTKVKRLEADVTLVEGAGGWRLPLGMKADKSSYQFLSDFAIQEKLSVVLIVNMKLGCLNHALLTYEMIKADGVDCIAWVANCASSESMDFLAENIAELEQLLPLPKIAQIDFIADINEQGEKVSIEDKIKHVSQYINLSPLVT